MSSITPYTANVLCSERYQSSCGCYTGCDGQGWADFWCVAISSMFIVAILKSMYITRQRRAIRVRTVSQPVINSWYGHTSWLGCCDKAMLKYGKCMCQDARVWSLGRIEGVVSKLGVHHYSLSYVTDLLLECICRGSRFVSR